ncbi:hypothetical protein [Acinetobacter bereziniae]|uniref:hypothetical protein n=1 Tax=Acinetobacter bereziniae TaxID=106648 RepID=UPI0012504E2A|nr:hypothetical protein [Acinetobacter bereziniae]
MDLLKARVKKFNEVIKQAFEDDLDSSEFYRIEQENEVCIKDIQELLPFWGMNTPPSLLEFYSTLGSLGNQADDSFYLEIPSPPKLLKELNTDQHFDKRYSMGLVDAMKRTWANDRPEFNQCSKSEIDYINAHYKFIGLYRYNGQLEEAFYIYFDQNQKFGLVRYHQDEFDDLWEEHLTPMLKASQASQNLEQLLIQVIDHLEAGILEDID